MLKGRSETYRDVYRDISCVFVLRYRLHVETRISELEEDLKVETAQFMTRRSALETLINAQLQKFLKTKLRKFPPLEKNEDSTKKSTLYLLIKA